MRGPRRQIACDVPLHGCRRWAAGMQHSHGLMTISLVIVHALHSIGQSSTVRVSIDRLCAYVCDDLEKQQCNLRLPGLTPNCSATGRLQRAIRYRRGSRIPTNRTTDQIRHRVGAQMLARALQRVSELRHPQLLLQQPRHLHKQNRPWTAAARSTDQRAPP
jgi:hypothetical protein